MEKLIVEGIDFTEFLGIPYVGSRHPGNISVDEFLANPRLGANCQLLTLGVESRANYLISPAIQMDQEGRFGSKELWLDTECTGLVASGGLSAKALWLLFLLDELKVFDIYFFWPPGVCFSKTISDIDPELFKKLHTAVWMGFVDTDKGGYVSLWLHNAKPGPSALWPMQEFHDRNYSLFGVKRPTVSMPK